MGAMIQQHPVSNRVLAVTVTAAVAVAVYPGIPAVADRLGSLHSRSSTVLHYHRKTGSYWSQQVIHGNWGAEQTAVAACKAAAAAATVGSPPVGARGVCWHRC
jgi:hypothetical protein